MTSWAKPSAYLLAYRYANESEWRRHLLWLETEGYPQIKALRADRKGNPGSEGIRAAPADQQGGVNDGPGGFDFVRDEE